MSQKFSSKILLSFDTRKALLVLFLGAAVLGIQMVKIDRPYTGHFASYQTISASIARNMLRDNFAEPLALKTDALIGGISGERALHLAGYFFHSLIAALAVKFAGGTLEFWGRFQAIIFNLLSAVLLGLIAARFFGRKTGWIAAVIYSFSPFTLVYGQSFMTEAISLFFFLLAFYLLLPASPSPLSSPPLRGREKGEGVSFGTLILSAISFSIAITGRMHFVLIFPGYLLYLVLNPPTRRLSFILLFSFFAFLLPVAWYAYTYYLSAQSNIIYTNLPMQFRTLLLKAGPGGGLHYLLNLEYYRRVFDTVCQFMLTPAVFPFFLLSFFLADKRKKEFWIVAISLFLTSLVIATAPYKIMVHDFYLYPAFPFIAILASLGVSRVLEAFPVLATARSLTLLLLLYLGISSRFFLHPIFKSPAHETQEIAAARLVRESTKPDDTLIVAGNATGIFVYYVDRAAFIIELNRIGKVVLPHFQYQAKTESQRKILQEVELASKSAVTWFQYLKGQGAKYFAASIKKELEETPDLLHYLEQNYSQISSAGDSFYFFDLTRSKL